MELDKKFYIGKVIYNEDPTFAGRCKVRVFGMFDEMEDKFIPWFAPVNSEIFSTRGAGSISVPKIGDIVRVTFPNNDLYSGEYSSIQSLDPDLVEEIKDDYLGTHVLLFDAEAELVVLYQVKTGFKIYHKGSHIILDPTGMIQAKHSNNNNVIEISDKKIVITTASGEDGSNNSTGTIDITSNNQVNITANTVNVKGGTINLANKAGVAPHPAVKGDLLQTALKEIAAVVDMKYPPGPTLSSKTWQEITTDNVKIQD